MWGTFLGVPHARKLPYIPGLRSFYLEGRGT